MSDQSKPSIVFAHGLWADGSCFSKLIPTLLAEGHEVMASQHGLDSLATDVAAVKACLARVRKGDRRQVFSLLRIRPRRATERFAQSEARSLWSSSAICRLVRG
jgi:hypothetical protein